MIKKLIILITLFCLSCQSQITESKISNNNSEYLIQHPKDWTFFNYGFDGDTYEDPYLEANSTLTYGKLLDAKIAIYFIKKELSSSNCVLKESISYSYQEDKINLTEDNRRKALSKFFDEWKKNDQIEFARVYFAVDNKECVLFDLIIRKKSDQEKILNYFYQIISSFEKIKN